MFFQGAGIIVILALILFIPTRYLINLILGNNYYAAHTWPKGLCFLVTGAVVWIIGMYLNHDSKKNEFAPVHTFMFLKMEYWGIAYAVIALFIFVIG